MARSCTVALHPLASVRHRLPGELGTKASAISMLEAFVSHIRDSTDNQSSSRHMFLCAAIFEMTRYLERKSRSILQATANKLI